MFSRFLMAKFHHANMARQTLCHLLPWRREDVNNPKGLVGVLQSIKPFCGCLIPASSFVTFIFSRRNFLLRKLFRSETSKQWHWMTREGCVSEGWRTKRGESCDFDSTWRSSHVELVDEAWMDSCGRLGWCRVLMGVVCDRDYDYNYRL